jgi:uncharacterized protein (DUF885 family)
MVTVEQGLYVDTALETLRPSVGKFPWSLAMPAGTEGIWRLPNGPAIYALLLGRLIGETIEPDVAHKLLEAEVDRLQKRADQLLASFGYKGATTGDRFRAAFADAAFLYPDTDAGRDEAVADMNATLAAAKARVKHDFLTRATGPNLIPTPTTYRHPRGGGDPYILRAEGADRSRPMDPRLRGDDGSDWGSMVINVSVERMPAAEEAAGKQGYRRLPEPGRPGAYVVDLRQIRRRPRWSLPAVVHHELLPGHMLQLPIEAQANPHPLRLAYLPAFPEGWAIHAEAWMLETGGLELGSRAELGQIHWLLFRATRGLIDTGIHHRRWSASKARKTLEEVQGEPAYFADFASDIDRVIRDPGLRAAEALTWIRLHQLRAAAGESGGKRTDDANFHAMVLANGRKRLDRLQSSV